MWPSHLVPHLKWTRTKVEWNFKKRSTTSNSPRCAPSKRCKACKKNQSVMQKKKSHCVSQKWRERFRQLTKETRSLKNKNTKHPWQCLKKRANNQFQLVQTCSSKLQCVYHLLTRQLCHHVCFNCAVAWGVLKPWSFATIFFYGIEKCKTLIGLLLTHFHNTRPHLGTDISSCKLSNMSRKC